MIHKGTIILAVQKLITNCWWRKNTNEKYEILEHWATLQKELECKVEKFACECDSISVGM